MTAEVVPIQEGEDPLSEIWKNCFTVSMKGEVRFVARAPADAVDAWIAHLNATAGGGAAASADGADLKVSKSRTHTGGDEATAVKAKLAKDGKDIEFMSELTSLVNYFTAVKHHHGPYAPHQMSSVKEAGFKKWLRNDTTGACNFMFKNMLRLYPAGTRIGSSNYDPGFCWNFGVQMVALNMQVNLQAIFPPWGLVCRGRRSVAEACSPPFLVGGSRGGAGLMAPYFVWHRGVWLRRAAAMNSFYSSSSPPRARAGCSLSSGLRVLARSVFPHRAWFLSVRVRVLFTLSVQTTSAPMWLNECMFAQTGQSGYVRKPAILKDPALYPLASLDNLSSNIISMLPTDVFIRVLSGRLLPLGFKEKPCVLMLAVFFCAFFWFFLGLSVCSLLPTSR